MYPLKTTYVYGFAFHCNLCLSFNNFTFSIISLSLILFFLSYLIYKLLHIFLFSLAYFLPANLLIFIPGFFQLIWRWCICLFLAMIPLITFLNTHIWIYYYLFLLLLPTIFSLKPIASVTMILIVSSFALLLSLTE